MKVSKEKLMELYRSIARIRRFEEKVFDLFAQNLIPGTIHLYIGQEAVAAGVCGNLRREDYVTSTHRGHAHCLAKGARMDRMMAEILGKGTGYCKGKGGSMHVADLSVGVLGATAVVGAGIPIAVGAALSARLRGTEQVVACFFGDGASNTGAFHEGINMATIWDLPVLFVCENNLYAMGTRLTRATRVVNVAERAASYGIPGITVDGMDVVPVYLSAGEAVERARKGKGPTLLECRTYRFKGHSRFDPATYRPGEEVEEWTSRDPLRLFVAKGYLSQEEASRIDGEVSAEVEEATRFAIESPYPKPEEALEDVYSEGRMSP